MLTFILLYTFYLALRYEHRAAKREAAKKLKDAKIGEVTVATIVINDDFP